MSKHAPAHARPDGPDDPGGSGSSGTPLGAALRDLGPPRHGADFWSDLDARLADEPQLRLAPRSAIRPITQPPPVIDDRNLLEGLRGSEIPRPPRPSSRRTIVGVVAAALVLLLVLAALQNPDDDSTSTGDGDASGQSETTDGRTPTSDGADAPAATAPAPTTPPGTIDPAAPLTPQGVGPLRIGASMADLQAVGMIIQPDQAEFRGSGGTCYVARVAGALDLELRFRAPDGERRADEPAQGVLTSVSIEAGLPTARTSDTAIGIGAPQDQVLAAYAGNLDDRSHPMVSNGHIYRANAGDGTGIAFQTDGMGVIGITVGEYDAVRYINQCG